MTEKAKIDYTAFPDEEQLAQAEQYIFDLIDGGLEAYKAMRTAKTSNYEMHLRFGHSKNEELRKMWKEFIKPLEAEKPTADSILQKQMLDNLRTAKEKEDTYDCKYEICQDQESYLVIGMAKAGKTPNKPGFGYQIVVSKREAPKFYEYCKTALQTNKKPQAQEDDHRKG